MVSDRGTGAILTGTASLHIETSLTSRHPRKKKDKQTNKNPSWAATNSEVCFFFLYAAVFHILFPTVCTQANKILIQEVA